MNHDRILGALLGTAIGDALGMPIDGLSHQNVRTYYKGIKGYRADEHRRDFDAGQWTGHTQRTFALVRSFVGETWQTGVSMCFANELKQELPKARRWTENTRHAVRAFVQGTGGDGDNETCEAAVMSAPIGLEWTAYGRTWTSTGLENERVFESYRDLLGIGYGGAALAAGFGHAVAVRRLMSHTPYDLNGSDFLNTVADATAWAEDQIGEVAPSPAARLHTLADHLDDFPLDLQDRCGGTGRAADEAWPFAVAMVARNPQLLEATVLPAINVGGAASAVGACVGALVGALHGWQAFPAEWREGLEDVARLETEARTFAEALTSP